METRASDGAPGPQTRGESASGNAASVVAGSITHAATAMPTLTASRNVPAAWCSPTTREAARVTMSAMTRSSRISHVSRPPELTEHCRRRLALHKQQMHPHRAVGDGQGEHRREQRVAQRLAHPRRQPPAPDGQHREQRHQHHLVNAPEHPRQSLGPRRLVARRGREDTVRHGPHQRIEFRGNLRGASRNAPQGSSSGISRRSRPARAETGGSGY